jgi:tetratricopeptide (TPR) repeat protein
VRRAAPGWAGVHGSRRVGTTRRASTDSAAGGTGLVEQIDRIRRERLTGLLEFELRDQRRALPFVAGELHLPPNHPQAARWRELLGSLKEPAAAGAIQALTEELAASLLDWGAVRAPKFHDGHARLPAELVGPIPTGKLLRVAAARDPRARLRLVERVRGERLVAASATSEGSHVWTPEELWVLERLRQPATLDLLARESPVPREALERALAGLLANGHVRAEREAAVASGANELRELAESLAARIGRDLEREPVASDRESFRQRVAALLSNTGGLDHYELLGLEPEEDANQVTSAFEELARLVHPANARRYGAPELAEPLRFLFERATDAYRTLTDPARRLAYRAALALPERPAVAIDPAERAREIRELARRQFDRAQAEERNGDYHTALTLYEEVVRLDPTVEHWSALARLQEKNPAWTARAIDSWRAALALDPENGAVRFALGGLHERAGELEQALLCYQGAASGPTPIAAAAAAAERLRRTRGKEAKEASRGSGARLLGGLFRRS